MSSQSIPKTVRNVKLSIVLDIGSSYTKCGFSGTSRPICIIPSAFHSQAANKVIYIENIISKYEPFYYHLLKEFISVLYLRYLHVKSNEKKVTIVENMFMSKLLRDALAKIFFTVFDVPGLNFLPCLLSSFYVLGNQSALILDCAHTHISAIAVYEHVPIISSFTFTNNSCRSVNKFILKELRKCNDLEDVTISESDLDKIRTKFCILMDENDEDDSITETEFLSSEGNKLSISKIIRKQAFIQLLDSSEGSIITLIDKVLQKVPITFRHIIANKLYFTGGLVHQDQFVPIVMQKLRKHLQLNGSNLSRHLSYYNTPLGKPNYHAWLGGSIASSLPSDLYKDIEMTKQEYMSVKTVPMRYDWLHSQFE
ncbi:Actin-related protein 10 [Intoshia linei]|uniref:Actin-related protein 10 n=1 Tax=Intoshia linei TaxID=1819745 RepID=A0A177B5G3_9BILA|nr:Actin-related protein 10 [Intoshia linei]